MRRMMVRPLSYRSAFSKYTSPKKTLEDWVIESTEQFEYSTVLKDGWKFDHRNRDVQTDDDKCSRCGYNTVATILKFF